MAIVYQHRRKDNGVIFYIGIGLSHKRAYQKTGRNKYWDEVVFQTDYDVDILYDNISWDEACEKEIELIKKYGRWITMEGYLTNISIGGSGIHGVVRESNLVIVHRQGKLVLKYKVHTEIEYAMKWIKMILNLTKRHNIKLENPIWENILKVNQGILTDGRKVLLLELQSK